MHDRYVHWFQLHVNPEPWAVGPLSMGRRNGRLTATLGQNAQLNAYQEAIREEMTQYHVYPLQYEPFYSLDFFFYRQRAEYENAQARRHRKHEADTTNLVKATEDALQGILYDNDRDVIRVCGWNVEQGPDVTTPGVVVRFRWGVPRDEVLDMLPNHIYAELQDHRHLHLVTPPSDADNSWPPKGVVQ